MSATRKKLVGVLALQGDFEAHQRALETAGADTLQVRTTEDLDRVDALVIPGGESTTMLKLLGYTDLLEPLRSFAEAKPVFGTCAGAILLATEVTHPSQVSLQAIDMTVERNGYGRQIDSRVVMLPFQGGDLEAVFIRAPIIRRTGPGVTVLAEYQGMPVLIEQGRHMAATFHPELTGDSRVHALFLSKV